MESEVAYEELYNLSGRTENVDKEDTDENGKSDPSDATDNKKDDNSGNKDADTGNYIDSNCGSDCSDGMALFIRKKKKQK